MTRGARQPFSPRAGRIPVLRASGTVEEVGCLRISVEARSSGTAEHISRFTPFCIPGAYRTITLEGCQGAAARAPFFVLSMPRHDRSRGIGRYRVEFEHACSRTRTELRTFMISGQAACSAGVISCNQDYTILDPPVHATVVAAAAEQAHVSQVSSGQS